MRSRGNFFKMKKIYQNTKHVVVNEKSDFFMGLVL